MSIFKGIVPKTLLLSVLVFGVIYFLFSTGRIEYSSLKALYTAGLIALLNFMAGWMGIKFSSDKGYNLFLIVLFGGMLLRLFMVLILIIISLKFLDIRVDVFIFGILVFYFIYLIIEILALFIEKRDSIK